MASLGMEKGLEPPRPQASSKAYLFIKWAKIVIVVG